MDIGIPLEVSAAERRVALTPAGVDALVRAGHRVFVEHQAGRSAGFEDEEYLGVEAHLAYQAEEVYGRADLVLKVLPPMGEECELLRPGKGLMCFLQPIVAPPESFAALLERRVSALAMEMIENGQGDAPVLHAISEIAGPMSVHIAANLLQSDSGGRGILLGGAPGIPPAVVVILGAGTVGTTAAGVALGNGAQVVVLDSDPERLRRVAASVGPGLTTMFAHERNVAQAVGFADVLIGAVLVRGGRTPMLVTDAMVGLMKPGAVVIDLSIDQGGCLETIRPTRVDQPTYVHRGVVHYAVPNMTANVARTATYALTQACLPFVMRIAELGVESACLADPGLRRGLITALGHCLHPTVAERFGVEPASAAEVLATEETRP